MKNLFSSSYDMGLRIVLLGGSVEDRLGRSISLVAASRPAPTVKVQDLREICDRHINSRIKNPP